MLRAVDALLLQFEHRFAEAYAQRSLFASEERYREIVELSSDVLATIDQEGMLTRLNVRFEALFGHSRQAWIGRPITALAVAADVPALRALVLSASRAEAPREATIRCGTRAGLTKVMTVRITRLYGEDASLALMRDVTEEVARRAQILHSEKLSSIGQVAASVAHELNNPMAWVMANLSRSGAGRTSSSRRRARSPRAPTRTCCAPSTSSTLLPRGARRRRADAGHRDRSQPLLRAAASASPSGSIWST